jgi:hypothetical protein
LETDTGAQAIASTCRTARCGPACRVVWQGTRRHHLRAPMPIVPSMNDSLEVEVLYPA